RGGRVELAEALLCVAEAPAYGVREQTRALLLEISLVVGRGVLPIAAPVGVIAGNAQRVQPARRVRVLLHDLLGDRPRAVVVRAPEQVARLGEPLGRGVLLARRT